LPVLTLAASVARFSASLRDRRLANLRLLGLSPLQTRVVAAVETGAGAVVGTTAGVVLFLGLHPMVARIPVGDRKWSVADVMPSAASWLLAVLAVPLVAVTVAALPQRLDAATAVASARRADARRPGWWRVLPLIVGVSTCLVIGARADGGDIGIATAYTLMGAMAMTGIGVLLVVPVFVRLLADALVGSSRGAGVLIAARRMQAQPAGVSRLVGALMVGLFVVAGARMVLAAFESTPQYVAADHAVHVAQVVTVDASARHQPMVEKRIEMLPTVRTTATFTSLQGRYRAAGSTMGANILVGTCADLRRVAPGATGCSDREARWLNRYHDDAPGRIRLHTDGVDDRRWIASPTRQIHLDPVYQIEQWVDIFVPQALIQPGPLTAKAHRTIVVLGAPGRDLAEALDTVGLASSWPDFESYDFVSGLRAILWAISVAVLCVGLLAFAVSGIDRAIARRRELASLQILGTPPSLLRRAQWWEAALPTGIGAALAIVAGWLAGFSYLRLGESQPVVPWASMGLLAACALAAAALVAGLTVVATNVRLTPDVIRSE
jgi:hypothetical protein